MPICNTMPEIFATVKKKELGRGASRYNLRQFLLCLKHLLLEMDLIHSTKS